MIFNQKPPTRADLAAEVLLALANDFRAHGARMIESLRRNQPWKYAQLILSVVDFDAADSNANRLADEDLDELIEDVRDALAKIEAWEKEAAAEEGREAALMA